MMPPARSPCKCTGWQTGKEWLEDKYTCPAHSDIDDRAYPVRAVNKEYLYDNADDCSSPYKDKQRNSLLSIECQ